MLEIPAISSETLSTLANMSQILAMILTLIGIYYAIAQLRHNTRVSQGSFLLELEKISRNFDTVSAKLRPGGEWTKPNSGPKSALEWMQIEDYMGFLEHCEVLIRQGSLSVDAFKSLFGYRLNNIVANHLIVHYKLFIEKERWKLFWSLLHRVRLSKVAKLNHEYFISRAEDQEGQPGISANPKDTIAGAKTLMPEEELAR